MVTKNLTLYPVDVASIRPVLAKYRNNTILWRVLYWIAEEGLSTYADIAWAMGMNLSTAEKKNSGMKRVRRSCAVLEKEALIKLHKLRLPYGLKLTAMRLTDKGKSYCARNYGWHPCQTDWEKLIKAHNGINWDRHSAAVLNFAYHARLRGWHVTVLPEENTTRRKPDVLILKDRKLIFVEIETRGFRAAGKESKWRNQDQIQKGVAICMMTNAAAKNVASMLEENYFLNYQVTSLMFLQSTAYTGNGPGDLWLVNYPQL
jgi:hypothetical protein